jgi:hypothetical protein
MRPTVANLCFDGVVPTWHYTTSLSASTPASPSPKPSFKHSLSFILNAGPQSPKRTPSLAKRKRNLAHHTPANSTQRKSEGRRPKRAKTMRRSDGPSPPSSHDKVSATTTTKHRRSGGVSLTNTGASVWMTMETCFQVSVPTRPVAEASAKGRRSYRRREPLSLDSPPQRRSYRFHNVLVDQNQTGRGLRVENISC